jgi:hypothetical protein
LRPFSESAEIECRQCSQPLERAITDFGADEGFTRSSAKLKEHYGIEIGASVIRAVTEKHGEAIVGSQESQKDERELGDCPGVRVLICEMDGSMVPIVETAEPEIGVDRRKTRVLDWKEARLSLVRKPNEIEPIFAATMGDVDQAGEQLFGLALRAGATSNTKFHCLGDGAPWIADQVETQFGAQANYLIDFYHLCEYLSAAGEKIAGGGKESWIEEKKDWLKENRWQDVLRSLEPFLESDAGPKQDGPVRACYRYIANRPKFLDYKSALEAGLPIGSGEIESAHRYVIQSRLKISGAWWKKENAQKMLALRTLRANGDWDRYWSDLGQQAA